MVLINTQSEFSWKVLQVKKKDSNEVFAMKVIKKLNWIILKI